MIIDYYETEEAGDLLLIRIGLQFEDEPEALYVAIFTVDTHAQIQEQQLMYNGFDCKYSFKQEEQNMFLDYLSAQGLSIRF